jgi:hypothetical protein
MDDNGAVIPGALIYTYTAGLSFPQFTYTDETLTITNSNPVVCDGGGRAVMYLIATTYQFVVKRPDGSTVKTTGNITATNVGQSGGVGDTFVFGGDSSSPVTATSYPTGATYDKTHAGTAVLPLDSALITGTYEIQATAMTSGSTITIAIVNLDDGSPDTPLATCTASSTTGVVATSGPITFASPGVVKHYGIKAKVNSGTGYAWGIRLVRIA